MWSNYSSYFKHFHPPGLLIHMPMAKAAVATAAAAGGHWVNVLATCRLVLVESVRVKLGQVGTIAIPSSSSSSRCKCPSGTIVA